MPGEWQFDDEHATGPVRGGALPMGFNRTPHYSRGVLLVGDAGGAVNPFNGEGIAYAMESGLLAAEVAAQALARPAGPSRERALQGYPSGCGRSTAATTRSAGSSCTSSATRR
jgi:flavin-dependent dehydrogenase